MTTPTTIVELRSTLLQVPWRGPAAGRRHPFGAKRDIYVLERMPAAGGLPRHGTCNRVVRSSTIVVGVVIRRISRVFAQL